MMKNISILFFSLLLSFSCKIEKRNISFEVVIEDVLTNQYSEGVDFPGFIMYDIKITNWSDSLLIFTVLDETPFPTELNAFQRNIYVEYRNDRLALSAHYAENDTIIIEPHSFVVGRYIFYGNYLYEKKYRNLFSTYRDFSKDFITNAELYFISNKNDTVVVKNNKPLKFEGIPDEIEDGWILFHPIKKGKLP